MFRVIFTAVGLGALALGIWAASDLWTAPSEMTLEAVGDQEKAVFYVTGMT
ncbi:MAG: hypothetical protein IH937_02470 [Acidobacteria bacterium]|nr:hypothetical protein [Acidobacteriota bacterium]